MGVMSRGVVEVYVEFDLFDSRSEHFTKWLMGWLYMRGTLPRCREADCSGCKWYICSEDVRLGVIKVDVETGEDVFDFVFSFSLDFVRLMRSCKMNVKVAVCSGDECIDMNIEDLEKWYKEDILGNVEEEL